MNSKKEVTEQDKKICLEIMSKYKALIKDGKMQGAIDYLLKTKHELRNSNL